MEFISREMRGRMMERWEGVCREAPWVAAISGPPAWLVLEEWRGEKVEGIEAANLRVRERYGLGGV